MCNVAFDSGRIVNIKDHQSTSKLTVVIDASTAETFYTVMKPSLRPGMPICIHPNPEARQAFAVKNVTGDGRCLFRALAWHQFGCETMHEYVSNAIVDEVLEHWTKYLDLVVTVHGEARASPKAYEAYMRNTRSFGTVHLVITRPGQHFHAL